MTEYAQHTNRMTLDVTTLDGSPTYSLAQEYLMDKVAEAFHQMRAEGLLVKVVLTDSLGGSILDLDNLDDAPDVNVDCGHCAVPTDRCSDESDRNCMKRLRWESAGHDDEPGDQNADSERVEHGYWSLGPDGRGQWTVELIEQNADLDEITSGGVHLGAFDTEDAAKAAADVYERLPMSESDR